MVKHLCLLMCVGKSRQGQLGGKNTQSKSIKVPDQIKEGVSEEWTLISLYIRQKAERLQGLSGNQARWVTYSLLLAGGKPTT